MLKKLTTLTTVSAGLGAAAVGLNHDADAAEGQYNYSYQYQYNTNAEGNMDYTYQSQSNQTYSNDNYTTTTSTATQSTGTSQLGNLYTAGQCTWYVYDKVGGQIGSTWGNANQWDDAARAAGYTVNQTPEAGAILQSDLGGFGHVAYVESVNNDGSITVSEMNYNGGPFSVSERTISSAEASSYNYIHLK
ncbi:CHAP domain-containing protein [Staphylococcus canis]|uniref:CHAP domain-containing protein n=1 Tax=Staphylococcus canis TaxID=2724942 RepID=A0ABS0T7Q0_9STAP|nr:CHAP domain-containing protein [Staphylococcus canis]MBI5974600.1 CHAP domain-containing protein [Staphylococcus canis]